MQNPEFNKLQNNLTYRFLYDPLTCKYNGTTYELKEINTTDVKPHFQAGYVTVFDTIKQKWTLVLEADYYSKVENRYTPTTRTEYAATQTLTKINELEKLVFQIYNQQKTVVVTTGTIITRQENIHERILSILEGLRKLNLDSTNLIEQRINILDMSLLNTVKHLENLFCSMNDKINKLLNNQPFYIKVWLWLKNKLKK